MMSFGGGSQSRHLICPLFIWAGYVLPRPFRSKHGLLNLPNTSVRLVLALICLQQKLAFQTSPMVSKQSPYGMQVQFQSNHLIIHAHHMLTNIFLETRQFMKFAQPYSTMTLSNDLTGSPNELPETCTARRQQPADASSPHTQQPLFGIDIHSKSIHD